MLTPKPHTFYVLMHSHNSDTHYVRSVSNVGKTTLDWHTTQEVQDALLFTAKEAMRFQALIMSNERRKLSWRIQEISLLLGKVVG